ncbi:MAG: hypothetical protein LBR41_03170 [Rickettsiales bacterium]|jgi:hypothetical protein|nr:hypothetical protein [Rickettsiales bacterium]
MQNILRGGQLSGNRTYIVSIVGILSAIGTYLSGDTDIFGMMQLIFPLMGIFFIRKTMEKKQ